MKKSEALNTFLNGMIMDINSLVTPNDLLCNALNATIITRNGNENVLLNDMGNGRVESAFLPEGYVPLGTAELGGIIYVVSYNPLVDKCLIGSFPSPERNITSSEILTPKILVKNAQFLEDNGKLINVILKVKLLTSNDSDLYKLNPGDKYSIYSTNNGISNNHDKISDVGNIKHIVDTDPKNVTIHVVSIGEDGKIVYLDDSLKWNDSSGTPADYYIKECAGEENIETDLDKYRSLISSAYNVFNSKVSGELALLFELKVIDSFSVTWDANVENIQEGSYDKSARVEFYINYTSSHTKINPRYIVLSDSQIMGGLYCPRNINDFSDLGTLSGRKNDGTDDDILVEVGDFKYNSNNNLSSYIWNYLITPAMKFGFLDYLSMRGSINFSEIGSGKIELDEWRYFILDSNFYLNWGMSAYPEKNKKIDRVILTFIPFENINKSSIITEGQPLLGFPTYEITGKSSYSGYFLELINFGETTKVKGGLLKKNYLYLVDICSKYGREGSGDDSWEYVHRYRWLYTTGQWNTLFKEGEVTDFNELTLDEILEYDTELIVKDNIEAQTNTYDSNVTIPLKFNVEDKPYIVMGAMITAVNYNEATHTFTDPAIPSIHSEVITQCTNYSNLFKFEKQNSDSYQFEIESTEISHDDFIPTSDRATSLSDSVISKVSLKNTIAGNLGSIINEILEVGIKNSTKDNEAKDLFESVLKPGKDSFDINVKGAIFSRINADLKMMTKQILLQIKPFLFSLESALDVGMNISSLSSMKMSDIFIETHRDLNKGGDGFTFYLSSRAGLNSGKDDLKDEAIEVANWWDVRTYNNVLNNWMLQTGGSLQIMYYDWGDENEGTRYNGTDIRGKHNIWVKSDLGHFLPVRSFGSEQDLIKLIACLYLSLYYVDNTPISKELAGVTTITYLTNYSETLNIHIRSLLNIGNILLSVHIKISEDNSKSLYELLLAVSGVDKEILSINNINTSPVLTIKFKNKLLSHTFRMRNKNLYNIYEDGKATTIPAIGYPSNTQDWIITSPKNLNNVYYYNNDLKNFGIVNKTSNKYVYVGGTITSGETDGETRLLLTNPQSASSSAKILGTIRYDNGQIVFSEKQLLLDRVLMWFVTGAKGKGDPGLKINGNPHIGFGLYEGY